jgi:hypothetical protein
MSGTFNFIAENILTPLNSLKNKIIVKSLENNDQQNNCFNRTVNILGEIMICFDIQPAEKMIKKIIIWTTITIILLQHCQQTFSEINFMGFVQKNQQKAEIKWCFNCKSKRKYNKQQMESYQNIIAKINILIIFIVLHAIFTPQSDNKANYIIIN